MVEFRSRRGAVFGQHLLEAVLSGKFKLSQLVPQIPNGFADSSGGSSSDALALSSRRTIRTLDVLEGSCYTEVAQNLDASSLCRLDATCQRLRQLNGSKLGKTGPWHAAGARTFHGVRIRAYPSMAFEGWDPVVTVHDQQLHPTEWKTHGLHADTHRRNLSLHRRLRS